MESSSDQIGHDQFWEILSWMPAKSVVKNLSSFPKTLNNLLSDPHFLVKQAINSSHVDGGFFLQPDTSWHDRNNLEFHVLPTEYSSSDFGIPNDSFDFLKHEARVLASSQGIVLLHKFINNEGLLLICNPVTKSSIPIPVSNNIPNFLHFGRSGYLIECDPSNNMFIITAPVCVKIEDDPWGSGDHLAVYRNGKWEDETCDLRIKGCRQLRLDMPVGVFRGPEKGLVVYYLCDSLPNVRPVNLEPYVVAFDIEKKRLWRTMKLPRGAWMEDGDHLKLKIVKWRSSESETVGLVKSDGRRITVWVMEDYEGGSWRKVVEKTTLQMGVAEKDGKVVGCSVVNGNGLLFATRRRVYVYEMDAGRLEVVGKNGCDAGYVMFTLYANTLRPVSREAGKFLKRQERSLPRFDSLGTC